MASPLSVAQWMVRTIMPDDDVTVLEATNPGFLGKALDMSWGWIMGRLAKRYDVAAMQLAPPEIVLQWLTDIVTKKAYDKRGYSPSSESDKAAILDGWTDAKAEVKEAADSQNGLFDLPLKATDSPSATGISRGGPLGYSETSPYVFTEAQAARGRSEDFTGGGS